MAKASTARKVTKEMESRTQFGGIDLVIFDNPAKAMEMLKEKGVPFSRYQTWCSIDASRLRADVVNSLVRDFNYPADHAYNAAVAFVSWWKAHC